ncbi:MAG: tRNA-modifying protein YgfZ [Synechococcus sp.]|nr:tRNA-modifying protein YgfZ [Synechococcus sp.]
MSAAPWESFPAAPGRWIQPVGLLRLEGPDTRAFLHGQTSQALAMAAPGSWARTCCISPTGRMRALAEVLVDDSGAWLAITAGDPEAVRLGFDRVLFPADRVQLGALESGWLTTAVLPGPAAARPEPEGGSWRGLGGAEERAWLLGEGHLLVRGADPLPPAAAAALPEALVQPPPLESEAAERWRLQRGLPAAPAELNDDTNPFELGLAARVSLSKGCYVGQETLAKLATYDGVKQQLRRWFLAPGAGAAPAPGTRLQGPDGARAGVVTSSLALPDGEGQIGLALVRRACLDLEELVPEGGAAGAALRISTPEAFVSPPVGAGSQAGSR